MGFGKNSLIHRAHLLGLSDDMPERIEVIDRHERIAEVLPVLEEMVGAGLIVVQDVHVIQYRHDANAQAASELIVGWQAIRFSCWCLRNDHGGTSPEGESRRSVGRRAIRS